jgi:glycosyltransferase involved in cell wall biosynthesis
MLQAMASGCVVVGSATAPVQEFIENEKQGLLTDFYDVDGLARRAIAVLSDKATFQVLGDAARELMVTSYEHRACLEQLMRFFRKFQNSAHDDVFASFGQVPKG